MTANTTSSETGERTAPDVYDHLRPVVDDSDSAVGTTGDPSVDAPVEPGVYRVVGTGETVTLLQVGDADGYRRHSGRVATVDRDALGGFEPADNPDGNRPPAERVTSWLGDLVWQVRAFGQGLRARPVASLAAIALVVGGNLGEGRIPGPDGGSTAMVVVGALALAYIGSRYG